MRVGAGAGPGPGAERSGQRPRPASRQHVHSLRVGRGFPEDGHWSAEKPWSPWAGLPVQSVPSLDGKPVAHVYPVSAGDALT